MKSHTSLVAQQTRLSEWADCKFCSNGTPILKLAVHPF